MAPPPRSRRSCSTPTRKPNLLPISALYDAPLFKKVQVYKDFHASVCKALYSESIKFCHRDALVTVHPRERAGGRSTDVNAYPAHKTAYAMRDVTALGVPQFEWTPEIAGPGVLLEGCRLVSNASDVYAGVQDAGCAPGD